jgi:isopenicillin-N epimerase
VRRDRQAEIRPLAISHGANSPRTDRSRFRVEFDWTGTADPSAFLAVPDAIAFGAGLLRRGWPALRERNHALALRGRDLLCEALGIESPTPDEMVGSMASVPLPVELQPGRMQVMVTPWPQRPDGGPWQRLVRISAAAYNDQGQYERLAAALPGAMAAAVT